MIRAFIAHLHRLLRTWGRDPGTVVMVVAAPLLYLFIMMRLFGGLVRRFTGDFPESAAVLLVIVSWAFILTMTGTAVVFQERSSGLHDRFATMPQPYRVVLLARAAAEFIRVLVMAAVVLAVAEATTGSRVLAEHRGAAAGVLVLVAAAAAAFGTWVAFSVTSPQGAVAFMPLIVVAMFLNTALLPEERYRPALAPIARNTPVSAAAEAALGGSPWACLLWFAGIALLCGAGLIALAWNPERRRV